MPKITREHAHIERQLIEVLTQACELAKAEIAGFSWLTHEVDYEQFPDSLHVVWVFDTRRERELAAANGLNARMIELTEAALNELKLQLNPIAGHVHFDSEEECQRTHDGNWQQRLSRFTSKRRP